MKDKKGLIIAILTVIIITLIIAVSMMNKSGVLSNKETNNSETDIITSEDNGNSKDKEKIETVKGKEESEEVKEEVTENDDVSYKEESVIKDYEGVDWVEVDKLSEEVGSTFISGTGVEYTVVEIKISEESSRETVVVTDMNGNKYMIPNIPGFKADPETEILYYDIKYYRE